MSPSGNSQQQPGPILFGNMPLNKEGFARRHSGHLYPKLNPWAAGSAALAAEGEANFATQEKKNPRDFALWKARKPGEPSWESPWGRGRPGGSSLQPWAIHRETTASPAACKVTSYTGLP